MNHYLDIVNQLEARPTMPEKAPSLEVIQRGIARLKSLIEFDPHHTIVVAGTNGKGTVCATLEALLLSAGQSVGTYTSPHLEETTERIRINGVDLSRESFCQVHDEVAALTSDIPLSHFEMLTLMAIRIFFRPDQIRPDQIRWKIFEVGLGGTWDATNAVPHQFCVITSLGMDHQNLLGTSLPEIAKNKFGIIWPPTSCSTNQQVIHAALPVEVVDLAQNVREQSQTQWTQAVPFELIVAAQNATPSFQIRCSYGTAQLALPGKRAAENTALALTVFAQLGFDPVQHLSALQKVRWPCRMERIESKLGTPIYLSGDHNPEGIRSLIELLPYYHCSHLHILCGIGKDKDAETILGELSAISHVPKSIYLTETPFRGRKIHDYGEWIQRAAGAWADPTEALRQICGRVSDGEMILVTGSLYLTGMLRKWAQGPELYLV